MPMYKTAIEFYDYEEEARSRAIELINQLDVIEAYVSKVAHVGTVGDKNRLRKANPAGELVWMVTWLERPDR